MLAQLFLDITCTRLGVTRPLVCTMPTTLKQGKCVACKTLITTCYKHYKCPPHDCECSAAVLPPSVSAVNRTYAVGVHPMRLFAVRTNIACILAVTEVHSCNHCQRHPNLQVGVHVVQQLRTKGDVGSAVPMTPDFQLVEAVVVGDQSAQGAATKALLSLRSLLAHLVDLKRPAK